MTNSVVQISQYIQVLIIPLFFTLSAFIGIVVTSASKVLYGEYLWDPLRLVDHWDNRAAAFFASFAFALSTLGTNISANSISAANDFTALAPRVSFFPSFVPSETLTLFIFVLYFPHCLIVYQHPPWSNHLRIHWRLGFVPMGNPRSCRRLSFLYGWLHDRDWSHLRHYDRRLLDCQTRKD